MVHVKVVSTNGVVVSVWAKNIHVDVLCLSGPLWKCSFVCVEKAAKGF